MFIKKLNIMIFVLMLGFSGLVHGQGFEPPSGDGGIPAEDFERIGQSGWQFLKIPVSARKAAMGGVLTGVANGDANAAFDNPAELVNIDNWQVMANRVAWFADIDNNAVSVVRNFGNLGVFGLSIVALDYGDISRTSFLRIPDESAPAGERDGLDLNMGTYTATDMAVGISFARSVTDRLSFGTTVRYLRSEIDDVSMSNISFDVGTLYYTGFRTLRLGIAARNFGPDQKLIEFNEQIRREPASIKMPVQLRLGIAMDLLEGIDSPHLLTMALEGTHPNDGPEHLNWGVEYKLMSLLALRGGYRFNYDEEGLTLGAGLDLSAGSTSFYFDFAYVDFGNLNNVQLYTLGIQF
jgi:hypothetical protein